MRNRLLTVAIVGLATATPVAAHPGYHYAGGCTLHAHRDYPAGRHRAWTGTAAAAVVATTTGDPGTPVAVPISVECQMYVDGVPYGVVASASGTGVAADSHAGFRFEAHRAAVVTMCEVVDVGGTVHTSCADATTTPSVPPPVEFLMDVALELVHPPACDLLRLVLDVIDEDVPGVAEIREDGDLYVTGRHLVDCPPYA